ncbi:hypothetical protein QBC44DRAFT_311647 [Cladorrhinum sp. PSN332]|nr:hypothetical protein QBC44DRAFT_311647 [Cladorrhinum sp. PSN332]
MSPLPPQPPLSLSLSLSLAHASSGGIPLEPRATDPSYRSTPAYRRRFAIIAPAVLVPGLFLIIFLVWRRQRRLKKHRLRQEQEKQERDMTFARLQREVDQFEARQQPQQPYYANGGGVTGGTGPAGVAEPPPAYSRNGGDPVVQQTSRGWYT